MRNVSYALVLALSACGTARIIQMTPGGGTIELQGDRSKAMEQATNDMSAKCGPNNFTIVADGYEPSGAPQDPSNGSASQPQVWRIHFQCNGALAAPPPAAEQPPGPPQPPPPPPPEPASAGY